MDWERIKAMEIKHFYAHSYCSGESGSNENNKLIRRFLPKGRDFKKSKRKRNKAIRKIYKWISTKIIWWKKFKKNIWNGVFKIWKLMRHFELQFTLYRKKIVAMHKGNSLVTMCVCFKASETAVKLKMEIKESIL